MSWGRGRQILGGQTEVKPVVQLYSDQMEQQTHISPGSVLIKRIVRSFCQCTQISILILNSQFPFPFSESPPKWQDGRQLLSISEGETEYATPCRCLNSISHSSLPSPPPSPPPLLCRIRWSQRSKESARRNRSHIADRGVPATPLATSAKKRRSRRGRRRGQKQKPKKKGKRLERLVNTLS